MQGIPNIGRHVFGVAAIAFGVMALAWHNYNDRNLLHVVGNGFGTAFVYIVAAAQIFGGIAIQIPRVAKAGAVVLGAMYLLFAILWVPGIIATPQIYNYWGSFFEQFSLALGAAFAYASMSPAWNPETVNRIGGILFGLCTVSFTLEQAVYLNATAGFVPKWIPPGQMFWALATTIAFALAAVALLVNRSALLATRCMTVMVVMFGLIVWVPSLFSDPHNHSNWGETIETFAIAGAAWILAGLLATSREGSPLVAG